MSLRRPLPKPPAELEARLGYTFRNSALLQLALTHRSYTYERGESVPNPQQRNRPGSDNEQLEFLGDAVLGLLITEALLREFPRCSEGELTRMRSVLVSRARMAVFGAALGLGDFVLVGRGMAETHGPNHPAMLANTSEALLAAIYLDETAAPSMGAASVPSKATADASNIPRDRLIAIRAIVERFLLAPDLPGLRSALAEATGRDVLRDSKTRLQEIVQAEGAGRLRYTDLSQTGPPHDRSFTVEVYVEPPPPSLPQDSLTPPSSRLLATGSGRSKKDAQQAAATLALAHWPAAAPVAEDATVLGTDRTATPIPTEDGAG